MNVVAIIQSRMTSSRLPGKVLAPLAGKPVLWHVVHRLRKCETVDTIVIATSRNTEDDPLEALGRDLGVVVVRGSETNVLERFVLAARQTSADVVVRICGDSPLLDPAMIDGLVRALVASDADCARCDTNVPCIHEGFSVITAAVLYRIAEVAGDDPVAREHVTGYFQVDPAFARYTKAPVADEHKIKARMSVDTPADLRFLETVYQRLGAEPGEADTTDVVRLLRSEPELLAINSHVRRKLTEVGEAVVVIRYGGAAFGAPERIVTLADRLREAHSCRVHVAMDRDDPEVASIRGHGLRVEIPEGADDPMWLSALLERLRPRALVLAVGCSPPDEAQVGRWREWVPVIATLDSEAESSDIDALAAGLMETR